MNDGVNVSSDIENRRMCEISTEYCNSICWKMTSQGVTPYQVDAESSKDKQLQEINARLLEILEKQDQNKNDDEGKFYKHLTAHKPHTYDGEDDVVQFEDWITFMSILLDVVSFLEAIKVKKVAFDLDGPADIW